MMDYTRWVGCTCIAIVIISILWFSNVGLSEHLPSLWLDSSGRINFCSFADVLSHCLLGISSIKFSNHSLVTSGPST